MPTLASVKSRTRLVGLAGLLLLLLAVTVQKIWSADVWWQLKLGQWILANHSIPDKEMFSHTAAGTPVREMRWIYCAAIAWLWDHAGPAFLVLMQAGLVTLAWTLIVWPVRRILLTPLGLLVVALALFAGFNRWVMRPELITYAMTAAFLIMLEKGTREPRWRAIWFLPLLQVLWVNGHTTFLFGPVLAWTFAGADLLTRFIARRRPAQPAEGSAPTTPPLLNLPLLSVALMVTAACWINPFGHWGATYALQMYRETSADHATLRTIIEMRSPLAIPLSAWGWDFWSAAGLLLAACASSLSIWRSAPLSRLAVLVMGAYLIATMQRNMGLGSIMLGWVVTRNVADMHLHAWSIAWRETPAARGTSAALGLLMSLLGWYIATDRYAVRFDLPREFGLGVVEWYQPRGAEQFILTEKPAPNLFNVIRDGSFFALRVSDQLPIYIDGRTDAYGPAMLDELANINSRNWDQLAATRSINTAVIPTRQYEDLVASLFASPSWALVHLDHASFVFLRRIPENEPIIARRTISPASLAPTDNDPDDRVPAWKAAYGGVGRAWYNRAMGQALEQLNAPDAASKFFAKAVANAPDNLACRLALAPYKMVEGQTGEAEALMSGFSKQARAQVDRHAATLFSQQGRLSDALPAAQRALDVDPDDPQLRLFVADLHFQTGGFAKARDLYAASLKANVGGPNELNKLAAASEQVGDLQDAIAAYRQSLQLEPNQYLIWNMAGAAAARSGDLKSATLCFENALKLKPDFAPARRNLQQAQNLLEQSAQPPGP